MSIAITIVTDEPGAARVAFRVLVNGIEVAKDLGVTEAQTVIEKALRRIAQTFDIDARIAGFAEAATTELKSEIVEGGMEPVLLARAAH
jgi:hypothetical protein